MHRDEDPPFQRKSWLAGNRTTIVASVIAVGFLTIGLIAIGSAVKRGLMGPAPIPVSSQHIVGFALVMLFPYIGLLLAWLVIASHKEQKEVASRQSQWPRKPWRWRADWEARKIVHNPWQQAVAIAAVSVAINVLIWGMTFLFLSEKDQEGKLAVALIMMMFCSVAISSVVWTCYLVLAAIRWGKSELSLRSLPAVAGDCLRGVIHIHRSLATESEVRLLLTCEAHHINQPRFGGEATMYWETLWQSAKMVNVHLPVNIELKTQLPVFFEIPIVASGTSESPWIRWTLSVSASGGWLPYQADFEVPVFRVKGNVDCDTSNDSKFAQSLAPLSIDSVLRLAHGSIVSESPQRIEMLFRSGESSTQRHAQTLLAPLLLLGFVGVALHPGVPLWMRLLFPSIGLLATTRALIDYFQTVTLTTTSDGIVRTRRIFGITRTKCFDTNKISSITTEVKLRNISLAEGLYLQTTSANLHCLLRPLPYHIVGQAITEKLNEKAKFRSFYDDQQ